MRTPLAVAATIAIGTTTYVIAANGTCDTHDSEPDGGAVADAAPPDAAPPLPDAGQPPPPPPGARSVKVTLKPLTSGTRTVSFGMPMPAGVLQSADNVRVRRAGGAEIPAFVRNLGDYRAIPPDELLCSGYTPASPGVRSVLVQFPLEVADGQDVNLVVDVGEGVTGARLATGVDVRSTYQPHNDPGRLYNGSEGYQEPAVMAAIDPAWLRCSLLDTLTGEAGATPALADYDLAERNFFYTAIADYRARWDQPGTWPDVSITADPPLGAAEDGVWLYQRSQAFVRNYIRTGMPEALRSAYASVDHYRTLLYSDQDCSACGTPQWCRGFFSLKDPTACSTFKDPKYSYAEDLWTYYLLSGDDSVLPFLPWISEAQRRGVANNGWTERFQAYLLQSAVIEYEATGNAAALSQARAQVDALLALQAKPDSAGCIIGNREWDGPEDPTPAPGAGQPHGYGFSPWMSPILMQQLVRYYAASRDDRIPAMMARQAECIVDRGMAIVPSQPGAGNLVGKLIPFYGARSVGPLEDADGFNPFAGWEHAPNVANGVALGYLFSTDAAQRAKLRGAIDGLLASSSALFANWTRTSTTLPKFRLAPWRKFNWWFRQSGQIQWAVFGRPAL
jgi:hypothetical protein